MLDTTTLNPMTRAEVVLLDHDDACALVRFEDGEEHWAPVATHVDARRGDSVLLAFDQDRRWHVLAAFGRRPASRSLRLGQEVVAEVRPDASGHTLCVSSGGVMVFEFEPATGRLRIQAGADVELRCPSGDLGLAAGGDVRIKGRQVQIDATDAIELTTGEPSRATTTSLSLNGRRALLAAPALAAKADAAHFQIGSVEYAGSNLDAEVRIVNVTSDRFRSVTETAISTAANVYQTVHRLAQLRAGRTRTLVDGTAYLKADKVGSYAVRDYAIDGTQIYLG